MVRPVNGGRYVVVTLGTGFASHASTSEAQTLEAVWLSDDPTPDWNRSVQQYTFAELDPVTASEVLTDLGTVIM